MMRLSKLSRFFLDFCAVGAEKAIVSAHITGRTRLRKTRVCRCNGDGNINYIVNRSICRCSLCGNFAPQL